MSALWATILGLSVGSFLNVAIHRLPRRVSLWRPASHCPACQRPLGPGELIPVLSYLWQWGRCRGCGTRIAVTYPLVELTSAALWLGWWQAMGRPPLVEAPALDTWAAWLAGAVLLSVSLAATVIDWRHRIIPDRLLLGGALLLVPLEALRGRAQLVASVEGFLVLAAVMLFLAFVSRGGMGMGDVKYAALFGFALGPAAGLAALFVGFVTGAAVSLMLVALRRKGMKDVIPFGPWLAAGAVWGLFWGGPAVHWYLRSAGL